MFPPFFKSRPVLKFVLATILTTGWLHAAPYGPDGVEIEWTQPDGTKLSLRVFGDEFYGRTETLDGYTVVFDPATKSYLYANRSKDGRNLVATGMKVGKGNPKALGLAKGLDIDPDARRAKAKARFEEWDKATETSKRWAELKTRMQAADGGAQDTGSTGGPTPAPPSSTTIGDKVGLTLLIDFSDAPGTIPQAEVINYCNGDSYTGYGNNGSVKKYFQDNSKNLLTYTNTVTAYIRMAQPKTYYNDTTVDCGIEGRKLISDAIDIMKALPNYTTEILPTFDTLTVDGSNRVIACNVFFAGANSGVWSFGLWPHSWSLSSAKELSTGGKKVYKYQITNLGTSLTLGTFCHENGHMLCGYPDIYDYDYDSKGGAGVFCLMNSGGNGTNPVLINAYLRRASGWTTTTDLTSSSNLTGTLVSTVGHADFNKIYRYAKPGTPTEYYIFENRQKTGRDANIAASGIAIWHIDELGDHNNQSLAYNTSHANYEVTLMQADNLWHFQNNTNSGDSKDLYYLGNTAAAYTNTFSDSSNPSAKWWNGTSSGLNVYNFSASGASMTLQFGLPANTISVLAPNGGEQIYFGSTQTISWLSNITGNVNIELYKSGSLHSVLSTNEANDGSYSWLVSPGLPAGNDYTIRISSVDNPAYADTSNAAFTIMTQPTLADALDTTGLTWTSSGNANWFAQSSTTHDGIDSAQSGAIGHSQNSYMETPLTGPGTLTFWWKVSSETNYDFLRFYLDGTEQTGSLAKISGVVDWVQKTVSIPSGIHTVKWGYTKDASVVANADASWVDQVVYTPSAAPEIVVEEPVGTNLVDGSASIDCGVFNLSSSSAPITFTVKNTGAADLTGLAISKDGTNSADFTLGSLGATTLAPGASTTFTVTFAPGAVGARSAALHIASNDSDENPFDIALTGTGVTVGTLVVSPTGNFMPSGSYGGPFSPSSKLYTLSNPGTTSIDWTAVKTADWMDLSTTGGTLGPGDVATMTVSINSNANSLALGGYNDTVVFTNTTNNNGDTTRGVSLTVNPIPATVTLGNLSQTYDASPKSVSVTTNPPGLSYVVTYDGSANPPTNAGTYSVVGTITEPNYAGGDSKDLIIAKASQTIDFAALAPAYDNAAPFALTATASSGLTVSYASSNAAVATVSGNTVNIVGLGTTTITASQAGDNNFNAAASVPQTLNVVRFNPFAVSGGPYSILYGQSLSLNGSASEPSYGETITAYEWDLNNDNTFGDVTGATPAAISYATLTATWGRVPGPNTIQLKVTDSAGKTSITSTTLTLVTTITWDANGTGAGQTDGAGTWLNANQWWDGSNNVTWASDNNAIIGNGGAGGAITVGTVSAGTIQFNTFTGTYTLQGTATTLTQSGGITIGASAGNVTFRGTAATTGLLTVSGAGGITMNGPGLLTLRENLVTNYTGSTAINNGTVMLGAAAGRPAGNFTLNGGILTDYYRETHHFTGGLGTGNNQIQIYGNSGFGGGNQTSSWRIGTSGSTLVWGALGQGTATGYFNPATLRLRSSQGDNNGSSIWGWVALDNRLDLNGATRTIDVYQGGGSILQSRATINAGIQGTGTASNLIKAGGGALFIGGSTSNWGGSTAVNGGILDFGSTNIASIGGGSGRNISVAAGAGVKFNALSNAILNRIVETSDEIIVMTGTTSNNLDFSSSTGASLSNVWLGNWASNGAKAELSGTIAFGGSNYQLGARESSGLLGIVGTNKLTGTQGLIVGQTGAASGIRLELASANNFTGDTVINTGARLAIGNNLALQNSALNVGSAGGNISFSTGLLSGDITGNARSDSPTFGGLIGSRSLATVFSNGASNNEQSLQSYQMLGFTLNNGTGASHTYSGVIANFARDTAITKNGTGTQELSGVNTYTGVTTISNGILKIGNASALGKGGTAGASAGSTTVNSGGTLDLNGITGILEPIVLNGAGFGGNGALVNNSGTAAGISGGLASLQVTAGGAYGGTVPTVTITGGGGTGATATATLGLTNATITSITSGGTGWVVGDQFTVAGGGGSGAVYEVTSVSSGAITGWNIVHAGTGYTSTPTGITKLTGNSAGTNTFVFNNTNFTVAGLTLTNAGSGYTGTPTISFSTGAATAAVQSSSITLASDSSIGGSGNMTIGAIISESGGARALTKVGAGTLTLSGDNTYTGPTTVTGGILRITKPYLANASDVAIGSSGKLDLQFDESGGDVTDTVNALTIGGVPQPPGIYGATGSGATIINDASFAGIGTLTVLTGPSGDTTPPTLAGSAIVDDRSGGAIIVGTLVTYTFTFSEDMDASTVAADDFGNAGTAAVTIGSVNETAPGVFAVQATPTSGGTLQLQVNTAAVLKDVAGNNLDTSSAIVDETTITVDGTVPTLASITDDKSGNPVTENTLVTYAVTFSEDMDASTVTAADFGNAGSATVTISSVSETSPGVFTVEATPTTSGTLQLQIIASSILKDVAGNSLDTTSAIVDETAITVDGTAPTLVSITDDKSGNPVTENTLVTYAVTFSEDMDASTVTAADFGNAGSATVTIGSVSETSPGVFTVETTPTTSGTLQLQIIASSVLNDVAGNSLDTAAAIADDTTITVDGTAPTLVSVSDDKSGGPVTENTLVTYTVTFSEDMDAATVTAADFGNAGSSTVTIGSISETSPGVFTVEATPTTAGTLQFQINASAVLKDVAGNNLNTASAIPDDTTITVDGTAPTLVSITDDKSGNPVTENTLITYTVTFSEDMDASTVNAADFGNAGSSSVTIGSVSEASPGVFTVEVTPTTSGTLQLQINAAAVLKDVAGNNVDTASAIVDETVITVDGTEPTLASITDDKSGGTVTENTLITYTVTFSEDMDASTVNAADFGNAGSSAFTIGSVSETSPGVFTVEATPTTSGTLQFQINTTAILKDVAGNSLDTTAAIVDETSITVDGTAPTLASIVDDKSGGPVTENTLVTYTVTFSEDMDASTVNAADFGNAGSSAVTIGSISVTSPGVFTVEATPTTAGTLQLQIIASAVLKDVAGNNLDTTAAIVDETIITVDGTAPTLTSITDDKSGNPVTENTLVTYVVTFSEDMDASTVTTADFGNAGSATVTIGSVSETSPGVFTVEATPTTSGTLQLQINATAILKDVAGNNVDTAAAIVDETSITVDGTSPTLTSISDDKSGGPVTENALVTYTVTFSEDMDASSVSAADFGNAGSCSVTIGSVSETSPGVFTVEATPTTSGTLQLQIIASSVLKDVAGNNLDTAAAIADDTTITVDGAAPALISITDDESGNPVTENTLVTYTVTFSEDMDASTVTAADFGNAGSSAVTIGSVSETSPGVFTVEATPTTSGTLQLQIIASSVLKDIAGNSLDTASAIADETIITVNTADPYATWSGGAAFDADANGDGVENGLAWLLGAANPNANATGLLPVVTQNGGTLTMTFSCLNAANRGSATLNIQHSSDLGISDPWTSVTVPETSGGPTNGVSFTVTPNGNLNNITATISSTEAVSGKLYGRLKVQH